MTTTNDSDKRARADQIANDHGCDLGPKGGGGVAITVQGRWSQGDPADATRIRECRAAMQAAGVAPWEGAPLGTVTTPGKIEIGGKIEVAAPAPRIGKAAR